METIKIVKFEYQPCHENKAKMIEWNGWVSTFMIFMVSSQKQDLRILMQYNVSLHVIGRTAEVQQSHYVV